MSFNGLKKMTLDDTQRLSCIFEASENVHGHTVYVMRIHRGDASWLVQRRYSDFDALNEELAVTSLLDLPLPPKKIFGKLEREFIAERQQALQVYVNFILSHPMLCLSLIVKQFLDPTNYQVKFLDTALEHVSMFFRSEPEWEIVEPLKGIGWRIRKSYFVIKNKSEKKKKYLLSWMTLGPDHYMSEKDLTAATKLLGSVQHPLILPVTLCNASSNGCLVIYDFLDAGSLRDVLCQAKPSLQYLRKYANPKAYVSFELPKIRAFGYQILASLKFLHDRGFFHGNVHSGNVAIVGGKCKLLDVFSGFQGAPSILRPYFIQVKKIQTVENIDVYCFGHLLYEMAFGAPLFSVTCDNVPGSCAPELRSVLLSILSKDSLKVNVPSLADLIQHPFFSQASCDTEKVHFKVPTQLKESLKKAREMTESWLKEDQKSIRHSKRLSKVQAQLSCEDEKKKRSHERRKKNNLDSVNITSSERSQPSTPTDMIPSQSPIPSSPIPPPPLLPPPPPPPAPPPPSDPPPPSSGGGRTALLSSIQGFNKGALKKAETKDNSGPRV